MLYLNPNATFDDFEKFYNQCRLNNQTGELAGYYNTVLKNKTINNEVSNQKNINSGNLQNSNIPSSNGIYGNDNIGESNIKKR